MPHVPINEPHSRNRDTFRAGTDHHKRFQLRLWGGEVSDSIFGLKIQVSLSRYIERRTESFFQVPNAGSIQGPLSHVKYGESKVMGRQRGGGNQKVTLTYSSILDLKVDLDRD